MKRTLLKTTFAWLFLAMFAPMTASAEDIEINATNFPDENFRNYLLGEDHGTCIFICGKEYGTAFYADLQDRGL